MNKLFTVYNNIGRLFECRTIATRITAEGKEVIKKKNFENRITLIGPDDSVAITDLKNAQNLSTRRELKLVKIQDADSKTRRPVYKLMTNAQYHEEELARRKEKQLARESSAIKGEKFMTLTSKIAENDLLTSVKKMAKLLEKQYEVRVVVTGDENAQSKLESIYSVIERNLKSVGRLVQKRSKGGNLKFQLIPLRNASSQPELHQTTNSSGTDQNNNEKGPL